MGVGVKSLRCAYTCLVERRCYPGKKSIRNQPSSIIPYVISCLVKSQQSKSHPFFTSNLFFILAVGDSFICFFDLLMSTCFCIFTRRRKLHNDIILCTCFASIWRQNFAMSWSHYQYAVFVRIFGHAKRRGSSILYARFFCIAFVMDLWCGPTSFELWRQLSESSLSFFQKSDQSETIAFQKLEFFFLQFSTGKDHHQISDHEDHLSGSHNFHGWSTKMKLTNCRSLFLAWIK